MLTFDEMVEKTKNLREKVTNEEFLEFYSYYKQATAGDCDTDEPEDPKKNAMWQAWKALAGVTVEEAKAHYTKIYEKYAPKYE